MPPQARSRLAFEFLLLPGGELSEALGVEKVLVDAVVVRREVVATVQLAVVLN